MSYFHTKVAGVTHQDPLSQLPRQTVIQRHVRADMQVDIALEPTNPVDPQAVAVYITHEGKRYHLGYLPSATAPIVRPYLLDGVAVHGIVTEVTGGKKDSPTRGVNLLVMVEDGQPGYLHSDEEALAREEPAPAQLVPATPASQKAGRRWLWILLAIVIALCSCGAILAAIGGT